MLDLFHEIFFWHWFGLAAIFLILELLTGSGFLLWISVSAALVGAILFFIPTLSITIQLLLFALFSITMVAAWRLFLKKQPIEKHRNILNRRGEQYVGRMFTLTSPVVNGLGVVHVDDTTWRIHCMDLPAGARIKIVGVDGVILLAKPAVD